MECGVSGGQLGAGRSCLILSRIIIVIITILIIIIIIIITTATHRSVSSPPSPSLQTPQSISVLYLPPISRVIGKQKSNVMMELQINQFTF